MAGMRWLALRERKVGALRAMMKALDLFLKTKKKKATEELERVHLDMMRIRICKRHFRLQCGAGIRTEL